MDNSQIQDFGNPSQKYENPTTNTGNYYPNPPPNNSYSNNLSATGPTGSTASSDGVTASYGNTHSSTGHTNPIHPSDPQSTAHPAYGNSTFSSPYETAGGNAAQGDGEGAGVGAGGKDLGAGVGEGQALGRDYHRSVDAAYGHATGANPPAGYGSAEGSAGPYDTAGGNSTQTAPGETSTHMGSHIGSEIQPGAGTSTTAPTTNTTTTTAPVDSDRSTGSKVKEMAHGVKGLFAAAHGAGETVRGSFNAGVDRRFNEVLDPHPIPFPSLRPLKEFAEDEEGEFPRSVYVVEKGRYSGENSGLK